MAPHEIILGAMIAFLLLRLRRRLRTRTVSARDIYVVDGDTLGLRHYCGPDERIRISNIDAPETRGIRSLWEGHNGEAAKQALLNMICNAETVEIVGWGRRDRWGRTLARIKVWSNKRRVDIGETMIRQGHARRWT